MSELGAFHHVALTVRHLDASVEWYRRVLGFEVDFQEEGEGRRAAVLRFAGGATSVGLVQHGEGEAFDPTVTGLDHLAFAVGSRDELAAWAARLDAAGVHHSGPIDIPPGAILNFNDPDGIALALFWARG
jgi:glyoxylase I family protein